MLFPSTGDIAYHRKGEAIVVSGARQRVGHLRDNPR
jgi:hypothetical protein